MASSKILIIGAGPAGSAAAIWLTRLGLAVTLVDRKQLSSMATTHKIGESLPPKVKSLLQDLEVWEEFQKGGHLKCFGNKSIWSSDIPTHTDFIQQPPGYGWHIDRYAFEYMLLQKAQSFGTQLEGEIRLQAADWKQDHWGVGWLDKSGDLQEHKFDFIIDASGRNSWLARRQGVDRLYEASQLALVTFLSAQTPIPETSSLIETVAHGWWYSANIPGNKVATAFLCQPTPAQRSQWLTETGWWQLAQAAPHTCHRLLQGNCHWLTPPKFVAADSGILEQTYGPGWVAVGDAAMTYDPIASHGIMMALVGARDASQAIIEFMKGKETAFAEYDQMMRAAYSHYRRERMQHYRSVERFEEGGYWGGSIVSI